MSKKMEKVEKINQSPSLAVELSSCLSSTYVLAVQTLGCHWNVMGANFVSLHALFEAQYKELLAASDEIAERMRALGYVAPSSMGEFVKSSEIADETLPSSAKAMLKLLRKNNELASKVAGKVLTVAQEAGDEVTADIMIARMTEHDKAAWMLGALLAE
jgi:starvation-inducible DNA-binding protein